MLVKREIPKEAINYEMCKKCGRSCCKRGACQYLPSDFKDLPIEAIEEEIENNYAIIDTSYAPKTYETIYFLRVRTDLEDLNNKNLIIPEKKIYLADKGNRSNSSCLYYKLEERCCCGIKYDIYDEEKLRSLSKWELIKLFKRKNAYDKEVNGYKLSIEENIQDYLEKRRTLGWGGCLLQEEKRPGGALLAIPNYVDGDRKCIPPKQFLDDNWDKKEHQEKLKTILSKKGII